MQHSPEYIEEHNKKLDTTINKALEMLKLRKDKANDETKILRANVPKHNTA